MKALFHYLLAIEKHGYKLMYLSSRPIGQSNQTKDYLGGLKKMI